MNLPPLTAEVSLYRSNGHYRTNAGTSLVRSSTPRITSIYPTQTTWAQPTEVITVYGTAPVGGGTITFPGGGGTLPGTIGTEIITVHGTAPVTVPECPPGFELQEGQCVPIGGTLPGTIGTEIITVHGTAPGMVDPNKPKPAPPGFRDCSRALGIYHVTPDQVKACRNGYGGDFFCDLKTGEMMCCRQVSDDEWHCQHLSELWRTPPPGFKYCGDQDLENNHVTPNQVKACREGYGGDFFCDLKTGEMICCRRDNDGYWQCKNLKELRRIPIAKARLSSASGKGGKTRGDGRKRAAK